ncbi:MAG: hypothetical protein H7124_17515, partial [Phycisphaerales bacterium]|nr:hypothetical protein [Hyphomonadaceae bacterium]
RLFDGADAEADAPDVRIRKGLARAYVERMRALLGEIKTGALEAMRELCLACGQLDTLAEDAKDPLLMAASSSLYNYVKGVGATANLNAVVVQAHLDALVQLVDLPNHQIDLRQTVTRELGALVAKKLRQAGQAA